jgi:hypothetical protein
LANRHRRRITAVRLAPRASRLGGGRRCLMSTKLDPRSKWLSLWTKYLRTGNEESLPPLPFPESLGKSDSYRQGLGALATFAEHAEVTLSTKSLSGLVENFFQEFGLDPNNPFAWRLLVYVFAETHLGQHAKRGAPRKWTDQRRCELLSDFDQIRGRNPRLSEKRICEFIKTDRQMKVRYEGVSVETIRRNLQYARNPKYNGMLGTLAEIYTKNAIRGAGELTSENEKAIKQQALVEARHVISTAWKRATNKT